MFQPDPFAGRTLEELTVWADTQFQKLASIYADFDYEEGTWTPVLSDGTNDATSSVAVGLYTRVGRKVDAHCTLSTSSLGSVSGDVRITGLPFAAKTLTNYFAGNGAGDVAAFNITAGQSVSGYIASGTSYINLRLSDSAAGVTPLQATEWSSDGAIIISLTYFI